MEETPEARAVRIIHQGSRRQGQPFELGQLPYLPKIPTVTLTKEQLSKWRDDHFMLIEFAAAVCGTTAKELDSFHLMRHLYPIAMADPEGVSQELKDLVREANTKE